jgi:glycosyltransferase involved in cell wall biosynthesis
MAMPYFGRRWTKIGAPRLLLICHFDPHGPETVTENIALFQSGSRFNIHVLNLFPIPSGRPSIPAQCDFNDFDVIFIHCTIAYDPSNLFALDSNRKQGLATYDGLKVLMKQDEHVRSLEVAQFIREKGIDLVLTCLDPSQIEKVYPRVIIGDKCKFLQTLTGYVAPWMRAQKQALSADRPVDVGYRGSIQPLWTGRLGFEKHWIGTDFQRASKRFGLKLDISSRWEDRIYGEEWRRFLSSAKAVLGCESGSNVFDFDGEVAKLSAQYEAAHADEDRMSREYFERAELEFLHRFENNVHYAQISPRHFEAAATSTLQILYTGTYSGIFRPFEHYVPLEKDLSNLKEVIDILKSEPRRREITQRSFSEIIQNRSYWFETFLQRVDEAIEENWPKSRFARRFKAAPTRPEKPVAYIVATCDPVSDPRIGWMAETLRARFDVYEIGVLRHQSESLAPQVEHLAGDYHRIRVPRVPWPIDIFENPESDIISCNPGIVVLAKFALEIGEHPTAAGRPFDLPLDRAARSARKDLLQMFLSCNGALIRAARAMGPADLVVACDLEALPAGVCLKNEFAASLIYDAHEFWPFSFPKFTVEDQLYWVKVERNLVAEADKAFTVSRQLALAMTQTYGVPFETLPNAVPLAMVPAPPSATRSAGAPVRFLFLGGFGEGRGLRYLLDIWPHVDPHCHLLFQGPYGEYRDGLLAEAARMGLLNKRIFFLDPVPETDLIDAAAQADVGLIPYEPTSINNKFCCPNKLSQYLAAGIPILSNNTVFVSEVLALTQSGVAVDFTNRKKLIDTINKLGADASWRHELGRNARKGFETSFHWELNSASIMEFSSSVSARTQSLRIDPTTAIEAAFLDNQATADVAKRRLFHSLRVLWHSVPLLRRAALKSPSLRRLAERLREMRD